MSWVRTDFAFLAVCSIFALGCGASAPKGVIVTGKILKGGNVMPVQRPDIHLGMVELHLVPSDRSAEEVERALAAEGGAFTFSGPGKGVKVGKYKFAVYHREQGPPGDSLNGVFSDQNTTIIVDVPADKLGGILDLGTIDLDKPPTSLP